MLDLLLIQTNEYGMISYFVKAGMPETKAGFDSGLAVKQLLTLLVKNGVLKQKEVDRLLESSKTHTEEVQEEYEPQFID
jgi:hypothetical protein